MNNSLRADVPLKGAFFEDGELLLIYRIPRSRPDCPTLVIAIRGVSAVRLDVNGTHREGSRVHHDQTHLHTRETSESPEIWHPNPAGVPEVPIGPNVVPSLYCAVLEWFAGETRIDLSSLKWVAPRDGGGS